MDYWWAFFCLGFIACLILLCAAHPDADTGLTWTQKKAYEDTIRLLKNQIETIKETKQC